jgi:hypothetical protein
MHLHSLLSPFLHREAEHLRHKIANGDQHHQYGHPSSSGNPAGLSVSPALGHCLLGCSPPTGSFMARLAAAAGGPLGSTGWYMCG